MNSQRLPYANRKKSSNEKTNRHFGHVYRFEIYSVEKKNESLTSLGGESYYNAIMSFLQTILLTYSSHAIKFTPAMYF